MVWPFCEKDSLEGEGTMIEAILHYEFLQNAFFSGLLIGILAPLLGV
ncbi:MAG: metal ABC transporter permease, partial [Lysinibacillus fusiformis]|nr:metal ABC transporter permease [Lysinibacillus fusiformis]